MKQLLAVLPLLLVSLMATGEEARADETLGEYRLKGAFLFHFFNFVEWPATSMRTPTLCILGDDPFGGALNDLEGKNVRGKPLSIVRIPSGGSPTTGCNILFVARSEASRWDEIMRSLPQGVLSVSDIKRFARNGGVIEMYLQNRKVRLAVSQQNARSAGLIISSRLLSLAERVDE